MTFPPFCIFNIFGACIENVLINLFSVSKAIFKSIKNSCNLYKKPMFNYPKNNQITKYHYH